MADEPKSDPAFPVPSPFRTQGMDDRQWLAGMALCGLLASTTKFYPGTIEGCAHGAVDAADATLKALERKP